MVTEFKSPPPPNPADPLARFEAFRALVAMTSTPRPLRSARVERQYWVDALARMEEGRKQYGDASFARPPAEIAYELRAEALDLTGWAYILNAVALKLPGSVARVEVQHLARQLSVIGLVAAELVDEVRRTLALFESSATDPSAPPDVPPL